MYKNLFALLLGMTPLAVFADIVPVEQAKNAAAHFFQLEEGRAHRSTDKSLRLVWQGTNKTGRSVSSAPTFYVFNHGNNQGFVIISGEDAVEPVLAYSNEGAFCTENMPENLLGWAEHIEMQIDEIRKMDLQPSEKVGKAWEEGPMMPKKTVKLNTPKWDQDEPYNWMCPPLDRAKGERWYTGCAITAAAEIMAYYEWPDCGEGIIEERPINEKNQGYIPEIQLGEPYDWEKMPLINGNGLNPRNTEQGNAVAKLMFHLGAMSGAKYNPNGTSAAYTYVTKAMMRHMKYQKGMLYLKKKFFTDALWEKMLREEIDNRRPVLYEGFTPYNAGHGFVCDGYDLDDRFHINWGWSGDSDGFYMLSNLNPYSQGAGSFAGGYNSRQGAVFRIQPQYEGVERNHLDKINFVVGDALYMGVKLDDAETVIEEGRPFSVKFGPVMNLGTDNFTGQIRVVITDMKGDAKKELYTFNSFIEMGSGSYPLGKFHNTIDITINEPIEAGDRIRMQYRWKEQQDWKTVTCEPSEGDWEIVLNKDMAVKTTAGLNMPGRALATFCASENVTPSDPSVEAFYAIGLNQASVDMEKIEPVNGQLVVPANTGVILSTPTATSFTMRPTTATAAIVPTTNMLEGTTDEGVTVDSEVNAYVMSLKNGDILFQPLSKVYRTISPNRAYLVMPTSDQGPRMMDFCDITGIQQVKHKESSTTLYDLSGRRVNAPQRSGIYIKNGKKIFIK